jgi:hypothetical protein
MPDEPKNGELSAGTFWILGDGVLTKCKSCHTRPVVTLDCIGRERAEYRLVARCPMCGNAMVANSDVDLMVKWNYMNAPSVPHPDPEVAGFHNAEPIRQIL